MERDTVDWAQCYREGLPTPVGRAFVVPFTAAQDLVVMLMPVDRAASAQAKTQLARALGLLRHGRSLWHALTEVPR